MYAKEGTQAQVDRSTDKYALFIPRPGKETGLMLTLGEVTKIEKADAMEDVIKKVEDGRKARAISQEISAL